MELSGIDQIVDAISRIKAGVQLQQRVRPQQALLQLLADVIANAFVLDMDETLHVRRVVVDEIVA